MNRPSFKDRHVAADFRACTIAQSARCGNLPPGERAARFPVFRTRSLVRWMAWQNRPARSSRSASTTAPTACGRLVVDMADGGGSRHARLQLSQRRRRASCSTRRIRTSPGRIRPTTSRASTPRSAGAVRRGEAAAGLQAGERRRHRRRHDRLDADPRRPRRARRWRCRPKFQKNLAAQAWLWKDHTGHAEAAEITEQGRRSTPTAIWPSAAARIPANGTGRRSCTASGPRRRCSRPPTAWVELADFVPGVHHRQHRSRTRCRAASAPPATRRCTTTVGRAARREVPGVARSGPRRRSAIATRRRPCRPISWPAH